MSGDDIRAWMKKQGLSQRELAELLGVHEAHISRILSGERRIGARLALRLAKQMRVPMEVFFQ